MHYGNTNVNINVNNNYYNRFNNNNNLNSNYKPRPVPYNNNPNSTYAKSAGNYQGANKGVKYKGAATTREQARIRARQQPPTEHSQCAESGQAARTREILPCNGPVQETPRIIPTRSGRQRARRIIGKDNRPIRERTKPAVRMPGQITVQAQGICRQGIPLVIVDSGRQVEHGRPRAICRPRRQQPGMLRFAANDWEHAKLSTGRKYATSRAPHESTGKPANDPTDEPAAEQQRRSTRRGE